ncbi:MAG: hypothetical protein E7662_03510 [Ruminococcaceae bacterium]|nr:hypothetical protein [Oscillospiraceae bacterium]
MDKQIALMKKLQKDPDTIAYTHSDKTILIKREYAEDGAAVLVEITINSDSEKSISKRRLFEFEMNPSDFEVMKKVLTDRTIEEFNTDWRLTHRDVGLEKLENTDKLCLPSIEEEYIMRYEAEDEYHTMKNAMEIIDQCLTDIQKKRFIRNKYYNESTRRIAECEGVIPGLRRGLVI